MPGISTTGVYQQVRRMTIPVANWTGVAVSGAVAYPGLNTTHGLTDGRIPTLPSWAAEQLDSFRAWVVLASGATYGDVESWISFPSYSAAGTDRVQVIVAASLVDACFSRFPNDAPLRVEIRALFKSPHSIEGRGADQGEGFPAAPIGSLLGVPRGSGTPDTIEDVYVDATNGLDTNEGHSPATPWQTMGRVKTYMEFVQTFQHSLRVTCIADPVGAWNAARSNFAPEGVEFVGEARLYIIGHAPEPDATNQNNDKTLTVAVGVATASSPRDCDHFRLTPANGELWMDNQAAPANIALDAGDIGKTIRFADATHVAYATVSGVNGQGAAVGNRWVECNINHPLLVGVPAWVTAVNTTWTILDHLDPAGAAAHADAQVTQMAGEWTLSGIKSTAGSTFQTSTVPEKQNCIAHIRFMGSVTLRSSDRFAFPGCRFEGGLHWVFCSDLSTNSNAVSDLAAGRYFPTDVWESLGFTDVGTAVAFGGMGFFAATTTAANDPSTSLVTCRASDGLMSGLVGTGPNAPNNGAVYFSMSNVLVEWGSVGPDGANLSRIFAEDNSHVSVTNCRLTSQARADRDATVNVLGPNSFLARAINAADDAPVLATVATHFNVGADAGAMRASNGGTMMLITTTGTDQEGIVLDWDLGFLVSIGQGCRFIATGGNDANLFGNRGWLAMSGASVGYMSGDRTFAERGNAALHADIYVYNATLQSGPMDIWTKVGTIVGDTTPSPVIRLNHHANFKLGTPFQGAPAGRLVAGATGAGNGINCGVNGIVLVENGSHCTISDFRINNDDGAAGNPAIIIEHASFLHHTGDNALNGSYLERIGVAAGTVALGDRGAQNWGYNPVAGQELAQRRHENDFAAAGALTAHEQMVYYRHE